jgi:hypothetical protein
MKPYHRSVLRPFPPRRSPLSDVALATPCGCFALRVDTRSPYALASLFLIGGMVSCTVICVGMYKKTWECTGHLRTDTTLGARPSVVISAVVRVSLSVCSKVSSTFPRLFIHASERGLRRGGNGLKTDRWYGFMYCDMCRHV